MDFNKLTDAIPDSMKDKAKEACNEQIEELKNNAMERFGLGGSGKTSQTAEPASQPVDQNESAASGENSSDAVGQSSDAAEQNVRDSDPQAQSNQDDEADAA